MYFWIIACPSHHIPGHSQHNVVFVHHKIPLLLQGEIFILLFIEKKFRVNQAIGIFPYGIIPPFGSSSRHCGHTGVISGYDVSKRVIHLFIGSIDYRKQYTTVQHGSVCILSFISYNIISCSPIGKVYILELDAKYLGGFHFHGLGSHNFIFLKGYLNIVLVNSTNIFSNSFFISKYLFGIVSIHNTHSYSINMKNTNIIIQ